jgi:hypothetical protein
MRQIKHLFLRESMLLLREIHELIGTRSLSLITEFIGAILLMMRMLFAGGVLSPFSREFIEKGLLKSANFRNSHNKLAYMYLLTKVGIEEKSKSNDFDDTLVVK